MSPDQREWIEKSFMLLSQWFGEEWVRNAPVVLPAEEFFPRKWEATEDWARYAFGRVCALMHVDQHRVTLEFMEDGWAGLRDTNTPLGWTRDPAGLYHEITTGDEPSTALICVKDSLISEPERMVATMAHEVAHVLLLGDKKIARDMDRMEPLTDLMTVFCGFGVFTANAAFIHLRRYGSWTQSSQGYLSQREFGYSLAVFAWLRGELEPPWAKELTKNVRLYMQAALATFKAAKRPA